MHLTSCTRSGEGDALLRTCPADKSDKVRRRPCFNLLLECRPAVLPTASIAYLIIIVRAKLSWPIWYRYQASLPAEGRPGQVLSWPHVSLPARKISRKQNVRIVSAVP